MKLLSGGSAVFGLFGWAAHMKSPSMEKLSVKAEINRSVMALIFLPSRRAGV